MSEYIINFINFNADEIVEKLFNHKRFIIHEFVRSEDNAHECSFDEPSEYGSWTELESFDADEVAEVLEDYIYELEKQYNERFDI